MKQDKIGNSIDAVRREVRSCEQDGRPARALVMERTFDTSVDDVWDTVTNRERIPRWFLPVEGDLRLGGRYQLQGNASGEVTACDPPTHLAVTWEMGDAVSWVDVQLSEDTEGGTRLTLEHVALVEDLDMWEQFGPGAAGIGWDLALVGLTAHLRTGADVTGEPEATVATATGGSMEEYMAHSSHAWYEADIAFGTSEEKARATAANTLAFYTGGGDDHGDAPPDSQDEGGSPTGS